MLTRFVSAVVMGILSATSAVIGVVPPRRDNVFPAAFFDRLAEQPDAFEFRNGFFPLVNEIRLNQRLAMLSRAAAAPAPRQPGKTYVDGKRAVAVLPVMFANTEAPPYTTAELQTQVFGGPSGVTTYFESASQGKLTLTARVQEWKSVPLNERDYLGPVDCFGLCQQTRVANLVVDAVDQNRHLNWAEYDNDGGDGIPNSVDDDGVVDFVVLIHPEFGGECRRGVEHFWSHHSTLRKTRGPLATAARTRKGVPIVIDDFIVLPARSCDATAKILEYGVAVHEFAHAFALPDLYSTSAAFSSPGAGVWCVMAMGLYGGDGASPSKPTGMSAWAKAFLGWTIPVELTAPPKKTLLQPTQSGGDAYAAPAGSNVYYLLERRTQSGVDTALPQDGLLIWRVDDNVVQARLPENKVNSDPNALGVRLTEADGHDDLYSGKNWGDPTDPFRNPPQSAIAAPRLEGDLAICNLAKDGGSAEVGLGSCTPRAKPTLTSKAAAPPGKLIAAPQSQGSLSVLGPAVETISRNPDGYMNVPVTFRARVVNAGSNLFKDASFQLRDLDGTAALQVMRLPGALSALPPRKGVEHARPPILSDLLDIPLIVSGRLQRVEVAGRPVSYEFVVERAEPISRR